MTSGFRSEFEKFWADTAGKVRAYMFCACGSWADADDLMQEVSDLKEKYAGTFWGDKILASMEQGTYPKQTEYKWNREFWPNIRQYIKEKHYE